MKQIIHLCLFVVTLISFSACRQNSAYTQRLAQMDSLLTTQPKLVSDSLKLINPDNLNNYNHAYYNLLDIIAKDKTYFNFSSDSLINSTVDALSAYRFRTPRNYARSLMYQGIVRYRMSITDSTAYLPLKEAVDIFTTITTPLDLRNQCLCLYYLGEIHEKNNNMQQAQTCYEQAKRIALQIVDENYIYCCYRNLFWCTMTKKDYLLAKCYLDTLSQYQNTEEDYMIDLKNIQSSYFQHTGQHEKVVVLEKQILKIKNKPKYQNTLITNFYILSKSFNEIQQSDSALKYAKCAIEEIQDSTYRLNYFYFLNMGKIAEKMNNWKLSSTAFKKSFELLDRNIDKNLDTKILEIEKKYDLTQAENNTLRFRSHAIILTAITLFLFLIVVLLLLYNVKQKQVKTLVEERNKALENEKTLLYEKQQFLINEYNCKEQELIKKQMIVSFFSQVSKQNLDIKNFLFNLKANKYISDNQNLYDKISEEYENYNRKANIGETAIFTDDIVMKLTGMKNEDIAKLNKSDKIILLLLALDAENKEMAVLLNTSAESLRSRKLKLKKKIEQLNISDMSISI